MVQIRESQKFSKMGQIREFFPYLHNSLISKISAETWSFFPKAIFHSNYNSWYTQTFSHFGDSTDSHSFMLSRLVCVRPFGREKIWKVLARREKTFQKLEKKSRRKLIILTLLRPVSWWETAGFLWSENKSKNVVFGCVFWELSEKVLEKKLSLLAEDSHNFVWLLVRVYGQ